MSDKSNISWTTSTWNPLYGCSRVSAGCQNCYAEQVVAGLARKMAKVSPEAASFYGDLTRQTPSGARWTGKVKVHEKNLTQPLRWKEGRRVFVNSLSDVFHESVSDKDIARIFAVMAATPRHTYQLLTKRPERMQRLLPQSRLGLIHEGDFNRSFAADVQLGSFGHGTNLLTWPIPNVWIGVSVEDQEAADTRIPLLLRTPAAVRFLSCEPLLGPVDLEPYLYGASICQVCQWVGAYYDPNPHNLPVEGKCLMGAPITGEPGELRCLKCDSLRLDEFPPIDWVISGGESGSGFRAMDHDWARSLRDQCESAEVPFFFKQDSATRSGQRPHLDGFAWHQFPGQLTPPTRVETKEEAGRA